MFTSIERKMVSIFLSFMMMFSMLLMSNNDIYAATALSLNKDVTISLADNNDSKTYSLKVDKTDFYVITTTENDNNISVSFTFTATDDERYAGIDSGSSQGKTQLLGGKNYTVTIKTYNYSGGTVKFNIKNFTYSKTTDYTLSKSKSVTINRSNSVLYKFTSSKKAYYTFNKSITSGDGLFQEVYLYDANKNLILENNYAQELQNGNKVLLEAKTYYLGFYLTYTDDSATVKWSLTKTPDYEFVQLGNTGYRFTGYYGSSSTVNIPSTYNGKSVVSIGWAGVNNATTVNIPASVTSLEYHALANQNIKTVNFASGSKLEIVDYYAFEGDTKLTKITIPEGTTRIGINAFNGCTNLKTIELPKTINSIGTYAIGYDGVSINTGEAQKNISGITIYGYAGNKAITEYVKANSHVKFVAYKLLSDKSVKVTAKNFTYTGKTATPSVTVKYGSKTLKKGTDYTVTTTGKATGKQTLTITGIGKYRGTKKVTYYIVPKKVSTPKVTVAKKSATVKITKVNGASGYEIAYRVKGTSKYKTVTTTSLTKKLTKLTSKKKYEIKVRAYKTVNKKKYYGEYSSVKTTSKIK
jgi:hypothetical protein